MNEVVLIIENAQRAATRFVLDPKHEPHLYRQVNQALMVTKTHRDIRRRFDHIITPILSAIHSTAMHESIHRIDVLN